MKLEPVALTAEKFKAFGEVVELKNTRQLVINQGLTTRFHDLMTIDVADQDGRPAVNIFRTRPFSLPHRVEVMERHPLGSQGFIPMNNAPFLVLVAGNRERLRGEDLKLFVTNGEQGINLKKNTWHHYQLVLNGPQDFIVIDRIGSGNNLEEIWITEPVWITGQS